MEILFLSGNELIQASIDKGDIRQKYQSIKGFESIYLKEVIV